MLVDSKQKMLEIPEILKIAAEETRNKQSVKDLTIRLSVELNMPEIWKCREGNTLFIVHRSHKPGIGFFRALNADTAPNYLENSKIFIDNAYKAGFNALVTQFDDPSILNIFKMISRQPMREQMGYHAQRTNTGGLQVTVQLGPLREDK